MAIHPSKRSPQCTQFPHLHLPTAPGKDKQETRSLSLALVTGQGGTARSPSQDTQAWQGTRLGPELEWRLCPCLGPWGREPTWPEWPPDPPWLGMAHKACRNPVRAAAPSGLWPQMNLFRVFPTTCSRYFLHQLCSWPFSIQPAYQCLEKWGLHGSLTEILWPPQKAQWQQLFLDVQTRFLLWHKSVIFDTTLLLLVWIKPLKVSPNQ